MLHYLLLFLALSSSPSTSVCQLGHFARVDYASQSHRQALHECLKRITASIQTRPRTQRYLTVPGMSTGELRGVFVAPTEFLTVAAAAKIRFNPPVEEVSVNVRVVDPKRGLALLNGVPAAPTITLFRDQIERGRIFFAVGYNRELVRLEVDQRGTDGLSYYWRIPTALPLGTPVFNAHAEFVSLVALSRNGESYLLPADAFTDFIAQQKSTRR